MSDWTWEYVPDAANVVGGLTQAQIDQVESLASRIADAVAVRRIGTPFDVTEAVSNVKSYGEGPVMIWFLEDYRDDVVLVVRVQHFELPDPTGLRHRHGHCVTQTTTQNWNQPCALLPRVAPVRSPVLRLGVAGTIPWTARIWSFLHPLISRRDR